MEPRSRNRQHRERPGGFGRPGWVAAVLVVGGCALGGCTAAGASTSDPGACSQNAPKLTVQGTGVATGTPDNLDMDVDVSTTQATAEAALSADNITTAAVIAAFTAGGVTKSDLQTTDVSIEPNYAIVDGSQVLAGYEVDDTVSATLTDLASAGSTLDAVSQAAGNAGRIQSVSFSVADPRSLEDQARTDAVRQAVSHARAMAAAAGERLGSVCSLSDTSPTPSPIAMGNTLGSEAQAPEVPLEPGSQQEQAEVTLVYDLEVSTTPS